MLGRAYIRWTCPGSGRSARPSRRSMGSPAGGHTQSTKAPTVGRKSRPWATGPSDTYRAIVFRKQGRTRQKSLAVPFEVCGIGTQRMTARASNTLYRRGDSIAKKQCFSGPKKALMLCSSVRCSELANRSRYSFSGISKKGVHPQVLRHNRVLRSFRPIRETDLGGGRRASRVRTRPYRKLISTKKNRASMTAFVVSLSH